MYSENTRKKANRNQNTANKYRYQREALQKLCKQEADNQVKLAVPRDRESSANLGSLFPLTKF